MAWTEFTRRRYERSGGRYASDAEWALVALLMPVSRKVGRPRTTDLRDVFDAILYIATTGCQWRMLPNDFPPVSTVRRYFYDWRDNGLLGELNRHLVAAARLAEGRATDPSAGVIDSQSVKTTESGGVSGYDAGKRIKGRKRHIVTDTVGFLVGLAVHGADGSAWRAANAGHVSLDQLKVMSAIERCRTAALGGHVARCEDCGHDHISYNSCRNRHCPKCQSTAAKAWYAAREAELLPVRYFHLVFTLPKPVADIAHQNKRELYNLLMRASADTVIRIAADPKHLGARVGITSVLHTWGSAMTHHPHVHMIVPGGGLSADGTKWIACRRNFFLSVRVLSRLYRRLILDGLARLHGKLHFFGDHAELVDRAAFDAFLKPLRKIDWVVYAKEPFAGPRAVLAYLSRYTHRVAISNSRLIRMDDRGITFRVKDYRLDGPGRHTTMTLKTDEFIRRFLIHVLPRGQHRIRHYGLFGNGVRAASIARIRELLGAETSDRSHTRGDTTDDADAPARVLALPCPCCGGRLIIVETVAPDQNPRAPPETARAAA